MDADPQSHCCGCAQAIDQSDKLAALHEQGGGLIVRKKKDAAAAGADHMFKAPSLVTGASKLGLKQLAIAKRKKEGKPSGPKMSWSVPTAPLLVHGVPALLLPRRLVLANAAQSTLSHSWFPFFCPCAGPWKTRQTATT